MYPDPSICRVGADFYLVTSSFEYFPGVPIFHSRDLVNWTQIGHVLTRERQLDLAGVYSSGGIYAPTLRHHAGRFYMITTLVGSPKRGGNFYVTADDPRGPWSDPIWIDNDGFDPSLLFADGEVYYLRDGKGPTNDHPRVYQARIDPAMGTLRDPMRVIWEGTGGIWPEGAHVYKMKGAYYLFAAEGGTEYGHAEVVGAQHQPARSVRAVAAQPDPVAPRSSRAPDPGDGPRRSGGARRRDDLGGVPGRAPAGGPLPAPRARDVPGAGDLFARRLADDRRRRPRRAAHAGARAAAAAAARAAGARRLRSPGADAGLELHPQPERRPTLR